MNACCDLKILPLPYYKTEDTILSCDFEHLTSMANLNGLEKVPNSVTLSTSALKEDADKIVERKETRIYSLLTWLSIALFHCGKQCWKCILLRAAY